MDYNLVNMKVRSSQFTVRSFIFSVVNFEL